VRFILVPILIGAILIGSAQSQEVPSSGPERLAWVREHVLNTVAKFEFTQGYDFRKEPQKLRPFLEAMRARGFHTWDQMAIGSIWNDAEFETLERSIRVAGEVGLRVWATLSPPSGFEEIARMPLSQRQEYYYTTAERFARLARQYPNFVAFTCDDTDYNWSFFTPQMLAEMARRWRAICPRLAFLPLCIGASTNSCSRPAASRSTGSCFISALEATHTLIFRATTRRVLRCTATRCVMS
jgi:hypothetical protein